MLAIAIVFVALVKASDSYDYDQRKHLQGSSYKSQYNNGRGYGNGYRAGRYRSDDYGYKYDGSNYGSNYRYGQRDGQYRYGGYRYGGDSYGRKHGSYGGYGNRYNRYGNKYGNKYGDKDKSYSDYWRIADETLNHDDACLYQ